MRVDLTLNMYLPPLTYGFEEGAQDFLTLLRALESVPGFDLGWRLGEDQLWAGQQAYLDEMRSAQARIDPDGNSVFLRINDNGAPEDVFHTLQMMWGQVGAALTIEFARAHPEHGVQAQNMINLIDMLTRWKRPQHISVGPVQYLMEHHPVSRQRLGIRWMGWVPFAIDPAQLPQAEVVLPMNGGSLILTQSQFWQVHPNNPAYSAEAIQRAQAVELDLNALRYLPTAEEINRGDWGA